MIFRILRGGSFIYDTWYLRTACRDGDQPEVRDWDSGFRLVGRRKA